MPTQRVTAQAVRQTLQQRGADATRELRDVLGLPPSVRDTTILGTALAEAAANEARENLRFRDEVRRRYDELAALGGPAARRGQGKAPEELEPLVALRHTGAPVDPFAPPDPKTLVYVYGEGKLARALQDYTVDSLKVTAAKIEEEHPDTKPTNRGQRKPLIEYIVKYWQA